MEFIGADPDGIKNARLWEPPELVQPAIELRLEGLERPYRALEIRSDVPLNPWRGGNCRRNLEWLLGRAQSSRLVFRTPRDSLRALGLLAERPVATAIDWALQPPVRASSLGPSPRREPARLAP